MAAWNDVPVVKRSEIEKRRKRTSPRARTKRPVAEISQAAPPRVSTILTNRFVALDGVIRLILDGAAPELRNLVTMRGGEFSSLFAARVAICANDPEARTRLVRELNRFTRPLFFSRKDVPEVVIGAGLHAAIYCSVRVKSGYPMPLVLERNTQFGGTFAVSDKPSFFLNSRNRPGPLGFPGSGDALNVLPGCRVQPSDLSGREYQTNSDLALIIKIALALNAEVITSAEVVKIDLARDTDILTTNRYVITLADSTIVTTDRIVFASGMGDPKSVPFTEISDRKRIHSFATFMARMDEPFPLRDMNRIAVIGTGDSGKSVVEALVGQGPNSGFSVASMDYPERIYWWGFGDRYKGKELTQTSWINCERSRYAGIGRYLPKTTAERARIVPIRGKAETVYPGYDGRVVVQGFPFDCVVICTGFEKSSSIEMPFDAASDTGFVRANDAIEDSILARQIMGEDIFYIGPAARLLATSREVIRFRGIPENSAAIFRYAEKTAILATRR